MKNIGMWICIGIRYIFIYLVDCRNFRFNFKNILPAFEFNMANDVSQTLRPIVKIKSYFLLKISLNCSHIQGCYRRLYFFIIILLWLFSDSNFCDMFLLEMYANVYWFFLVYIPNHRYKNLPLLDYCFERLVDQIANKYCRL